ncbi:MAG: hypothetical protein KDB95_06485 [Flavobacteriales bacterium]|nr:hypothetical protein [Flavobacteriales bacterium]
MRTLLLCWLTTMLTLTAAAQKKELLEDKGTILARAAEVFDASLQPGTEMYETIVKEKLIGRYVLQVSFRDKGDISSVFVVSAEGHDLRSQNRFKDLVHLSRMPFKMPKGRQYRIEHTFDLNAIPR